MDNTNHHNITWSDADIRRYVKGELSPAEMHAIEQAALDDPFLADAIEGLMGDPEGEAGMTDLQSRLAARVDEKEQGKPVIGFRRPALRVAAAVIALLGIGLTTYYTLFNRNSPAATAGIAKNTPTPSAQQPQQEPAATNRTDSTITASSAQYANAERSAQHAAVDKKPAPISRPAGRDAEIKAKQQSDTAALSLGDLVITRSKAVPVSGLALDTLKFRNNLVQNMQSTRGLASVPKGLAFSGRVVDINNQPLAGASVFMNNTPSLVTTTDASGNFNFYIRPRDTAQNMTIALAGYVQTQVPLSFKTLTNNNIIHLEQSKAGLDEVVVTGFGDKRKETFATAPSDVTTERLDSTWQRAAPVIGNLAYKEYLDSAKRSLKLDSTIVGTERVSFLVDQKGQITEFKIEQSLSPTHDAGLIQLITTGPSWRLLRGRKVRAVVSLVFP